MIRPMLLQDIPRVAEIHVFAQREAYRGTVPDSFLFGKMSVATRMKYFADRLHDDEGFVFDDGFIKAFLTLGSCEDPDKPNSFEIYRIFVDHFFAKQGIGKLLASHSEAVAKKHGYNEICLWALERNTNAHAFYHKIGYRLDGSHRISGYFHVPEIRFVKQV